MDVSKIQAFVNGLNRIIDLSANTLVVDNLKIQMGSADPAKAATFSGSLTALRTISMPDANVDLAKIATTESGLSSHVGNTSNPHSVTKSQVGLGNVTNDAQVKKIASSVDGHFVSWDGTSGDLPKDSGYSAASFEPANLNIQSHISSTSNPHSVTKAQVGLSNVDDVQQLPMSYLDIDATLSANSDSRVASQKAIKSYVATQVGGAIVGAVIYKGVFDASAGDFSAIVNPKQGWLYKVSVAGTISSVDFNVGDNMYINKDVVGSPVIADIDKIDNTESADILRKGQLSAAQIFVGSASNEAVAVSMSGEASLSNAGAITLSNSAVIGKVLTGFTSGAGAISASDSILAAIQKADGNTGAVSSSLSSHTGNTSNPHSVTKSQVGLGNVTNDAQVKKISSSVDGNFMAWDGTSGDLPKDSGYSAASFAAAGHNHAGVYEPANANIQSHISSTSNPHSVTKTQVGLSNVPNVDATVASNITQDATHRFVSDTQIAGWDKPFERSEVAGESFAANSSFLVRCALSSETASRIYKADKGAGAPGSETNAIYAFAFAYNSTGSAIAAGGSISVVLPGGILSLQSSDSAFGAGDVGKPVYLSASGAFTVTPPSASNDAVVLVGTVKSTSSIQVGFMQVMGVN